MTTKTLPNAVWFVHVHILWRHKMKKTILVFGLISGVLSSLMMVCTVPFVHNLDNDGHAGYIVGYTTLVLSFLLVYFGIRSFRDNVANGQISFGRAFSIGILITLISCAFYVVTWEIIYFKFMPNFMDNYGNHAIEQLKASGASAAAVQAKIKEMDDLRKMYKNPLINVAYTFIEPFPVGLVITLISAGVLRKKAPAPTASALSTSA
jgi:Protein of unknown function (DUF4199)